MRLALTAFLVIAVAAFASDPRLYVVTGDARLLTDDYTEIWAYPGTMVNYEFATLTNEGSTGNWGPGWGGIVMNNGGITWGVTHNHYGKLAEVLYHTGSFGLIVGLDYESYTVDPDSGESWDTSVIDFDVAFGTEFDLFGDYTDFAIGAGYGKEDTGDSLETTYTLLDAGASVRGHGDGFFNLFPVISVGFAQDKTETTVAGTTDDYTITMITFDVGAGKNFMFAPKTHIVTGVFAGLQNYSFSSSVAGFESDGDMFIDIPYFKFGIEQYIGKWLVARAGGQSRTTIASIDMGTWTEKDIDTEITTSFGIGLFWDNFMLDAVISDDFVHAGPYMIGGEDNGFMGNIAAVYNF
jgi:hypothetical protein